MYLLAFIVLKYLCVRIKVGFMKKSIMKNLVMELHSILNIFVIVLKNGIYISSSRQLLCMTS